MHSFTVYTFDQFPSATIPQKNTVCNQKVIDDELKSEKNNSGLIQFPIRKWNKSDKKRPPKNICCSRTDYQ